MDVDGLRFCAERSARYHERRVIYYTRADNVITTIALLAGSGVAWSILNKWPQAGSVTLSLLVAVVSFVGLTMRPAYMASLHARLKQQFVDLSAQLLGMDDSNAESVLAIERQRLQIERDEPPVYRALDLICHNEVCRAWGRCSPDVMWVLPWYMAMAPQLVHWNTNDVPSEEDVAAKKNKRLHTAK